MRSSSSVSAAPPRISRGQDDATLFTPRTGRGRRGGIGARPILSLVGDVVRAPVSQTGALEGGLPGSSDSRGGGLPGRRPAPTSRYRRLALARGALPTEPVGSVDLSSVVGEEWS
jgi:hypothetical protein